MQLPLDRFGRMVLPKAMRDDFGLQPGDVLEAEKQKDAIVLRPRARADGVRREGRLLVFAGKSTGEIGRAVEQAREARLDLARRLIHENIKMASIGIVALDTADYAAAIREMAETA